MKRIFTRLGLLLAATALSVGCATISVPGNAGFGLKSPATGNTTGAAATTDSTVGARDLPGLSTVVAESNSISRVYEQTSAAVVNITMSALTRTQAGRTQQLQGTGSGFVVDQLGHIVTNQHVVDGATRLDVTLADESSYIATVVATDPATDLALLQLEAPTEVLRGLTVASLGDSGQLKVGDAVVAIGNPFGLERSATAGIVSSLRRTRPGTTQRLITDMIQTDAAINPGNSGGPLLNLRGEVIGINEQIASSSEGNVGVGFSIPVNTLKRVLPELLAGQQPQHAWIGIAGASLTPTMAEQYGLTVKQGIVLTQTVPGGPAAQAGLRAGIDPSAADIITAVDGQSVRSVQDVASTVDRHNPNDRVSVTYVRGGTTQTADVTLGVWQDTGITTR
jgi:S1-C subfamily serine protease